MPGVLSQAAKDLIEDALRQLDAAIDLAGEANVISFIALKYDQFIAPLNVPFVPDALEPALVDAPIKAVLAHLVKVGHAAIHQAALATTEKSALPPGA
jgi:hypothetical protein